MNWYIGQDIVAVRDHEDKAYKAGDEFKIRGLRGSTCLCKVVEIDIGIIDNDGEYYCDCCGIESIEHTGLWWQDERDFAPLDPIKEAISELMEHTQVAPVLVPHTTEI